MKLDCGEFDPNGVAEAIRTRCNNSIDVIFRDSSGHERKVAEGSDPRVSGPTSIEVSTRAVGKVR